MSAVVDNAIHIKVETIELGDPILRDELGYRGISLGHPSKEFGYTHGSG